MSANVTWGFPGGTRVKTLPASTGDTRDVGLIPWWGRFPGETQGNTLQYSYLENLMGRRAWQATVHGATKLDMTDPLNIQYNTNNSYIKLTVYARYS